MNPLLDSLKPYPFQRLSKLLSTLSPADGKSLINLSIGEPQHATPDIICDAIRANLQHLNRYPATSGDQRLKQAIAKWIESRYAMPDGAIKPDSMVIPVQGTREALFSIAQAAINNKGYEKPAVVMPNPFYQIYEGAAIMAGADPIYLNCEPSSDYLPDLSQVDEATWQRCQILYLCSPHNPTGSVISEAYFNEAIELADRYDFIIASDECYSEIYYDEQQAPSGILAACLNRGRSDFSRCLAFNSLSKRSNAAGLRSGFVAGDATLLSAYLLYRTYHGSAMPLHHQEASIAAWSDEQHVQENRQRYAEKLSAVIDILQQAITIEAPAGGFCLWLPTPCHSVDFVESLYREQSVIALPGSYLARDNRQQHNPGEQFIRVALVAAKNDCIEASHRLVEHYQAVSG